MKIIYLHQYFRTPDMAGGTRSYEMARRLAGAGHDVHMVTTRTDDSGSRFPRWISEEIDGIHVHSLTLAYNNRMSIRRRLVSFAAFALLSAGKTVRLSGDVVLASSTPLTIAIPAISARLLQRVPVVFEVRDLWPEIPIAMGALRSPLLIWIARVLERAAYKQSSRIVALSQGMADGIVACGVDPDKVIVIPNSCDIELFGVDDSRGQNFRARRNWLADNPLVVYCGTLGKVNGVSYMVELASEFKTINPLVRFLVIGDGAETEMIKRLAVERCVLDRSFFIEAPISKKEMPDALNAATVCTSFVIPVAELEANSANKFFDALAASRPIVINHGGWQASLIKEHGLGAVLNAHDFGVAARELDSLLSDPAALSHAAKGAEALAVERFSRSRLAGQLRDVLEVTYRCS